MGEILDADYWFNRWKSDSVSNACVVRVTNQCDQRCRHCCFRSGPECVGQMSVKMCERINAWVPKKFILNIMGGELTVLDNYPEMLVTLARGRNRIRLVTNGFWSKKNIDKFFDTIRQIQQIGCHNIDIAVSNDQWHIHNRAIDLLKNSGSEIKWIDTDGFGIDDITPIGRAWDNNIAPRGVVECSCESMSNMIITENGMVCLCPFGYFPWKHFGKITWADAQEYIWGWRSEKLAEGMNCHLCMEQENH